MSNEVASTTYKTTVDGEEIYAGDSLELAARAWDGATFARRADGGIEVVSFNHEGVMVRDGWLLNVRSGIVYFSPTLKGA